jgi:DNA-binding response OmpR family regulator
VLYGKLTNLAQQRILICEDDPDLAQLIELLLKKNGFSSDIAESAETAKERIANENYDVISVDVSLPGQDGISLIQDIKEVQRTADLPVIVVSMSDRSEHYKKLSMKGIETDGWVTKPIREDNLISAIKRALESST